MKKSILFLYKKGNNCIEKSYECLRDLCGALGLDIDGDVFTAFRFHGNPVNIYINIKDPKNPILKEIKKKRRVNNSSLLFIKIDRTFSKAF